MEKLQKLYLNHCNEDKVLIFIQNNGGTIFHEPFLNQLVKKYYNTDFFYLTNNAEQINCLCPVHKKKYLGCKDISFKPLYDMPYGGFIGDVSGYLINIKPKLFERVSYAGMPRAQINIDSISLKGETCMVDLSLSEEDIFNKVINSKRRNMIRKAIKNNVKIVKYETLEGFDMYKPLLEELHVRLNYKHLKVGFYRELFEHYAIKNQAVLLLAIYYEKVCSGNMLIGNKNIIHYYKGASTKGIIKMGQGELLQWEGIKWAKNNGSEYYDLCNLNKKTLPSLYKFKTGFSSDIYKYQIYNKTTKSYKLLKRVISLAR